MGYQNYPFSVGQQTCTAAATQIVGANAARSGIIITNTSTTAVYLGEAAVTTLTGHYLPGVVGASVSLATTSAIYGITAGGSALCTFLQTQ